MNTIHLYFLSKNILNPIRYNRFSPFLYLLPERGKTRGLEKTGQWIFLKKRKFGIKGLLKGSKIIQQVENGVGQGKYTVGEMGEIGPVNPPQPVGQWYSHIEIVIEKYVPSVADGQVQGIVGGMEGIKPRHHSQGDLGMGREQAPTDQRNIKKGIQGKKIVQHFRVADIAVVQAHSVTGKSVYLFPCMFLTGLTNNPRIKIPFF